MIAIIGSPASRGAKKRRYRLGYSYFVGVSAYGLSGFEVRSTKRTMVLRGLEEPRIHSDQPECRLDYHTDLVIDQQIGELGPIDQDNSLANRSNVFTRITRE